MIHIDSPVPVTNGIRFIEYTMHVCVPMPLEIACAAPSRKDHKQFEANEEIQPEVDRFRGHLILTEEGVRYARYQAAVSGGVPPADG